MTISVATKEQLPIVQELAYKIWPVTYGDILSKEQFDYMMEMMYSIDSLEQQLPTKPFLLVEDEGEFIGFVSYEINWENTTKTKIHKLYVLPTIQGKGIGKLLINHVRELALNAQNSALVLTVNRFNKAKDFYLKQGFHIVEEKQFQIGNGYIMDDYVMELPI
ncbi:MAG: GNAT family N-acetyltransferase [Flavobacteriales bacterium]|nr:GNAT family N-acetyltransferase [Flavobacteriales bacterium]